jgi:hypothetical protein
VLHAAALHPGFAAVTLRNTLRSWVDDLVASPLAPDLIGNAVPSILQYYDLPDLAEVVGTRLQYESR